MIRMYTQKNTTYYFVMNSKYFDGNVLGFGLPRYEANIYMQTKRHKSL